MEEKESILKKYHIEVTGLLTEMNKEEAIEFFNKYKFDKDNIYITTVSEEDIDKLEDVMDDNKIEYSEDIIGDIENLDDDTCIYVSFDNDVYDDIYTKMMKERVFLSDGSNKNLLFLDLFDSYLEYLKLPDKDKKYKSNLLSTEKICDYSLNTFINKFIDDDTFSNLILLSYNNLMRYYTKLEVKKYREQYKSNNELNTINDIARNELMSVYETLFLKYQDRINVFEIIHSELIKNNSFCTDFFEENKNQPICNNDYVKLLIINDAYLTSKVSFSNELEEYYDDNTILNIFEENNQSELVEKFNKDKGFALKCFLLFVEFNKQNTLNVSKSTLKKVYADKKVLQKINKYHFLDYVSI